MSRYQWPDSDDGEEGDDAPGARTRYIARRRVEFDPDGARVAARGVPATVARGARTSAERAPASGRTHLWQPLGPMTVLGGQATGKPRIAGRVNAIEVHDGGDRIYAASGTGGVWYSRNGGAEWMPLGGFAPTNTAGLNRPAQRNACGAICVRFGATEADDDVYIGTGEAVGRDPDAQPGHSIGGVGILVAHGPAAAATPDPWVREAKNLLGNGVWRIVIEPGGTTVIAATRTGLFQRPAAPGADVDWERVAGTPFNTLTDSCTDLLWTAGDGATRPARLWVWVRDGDNAGLWVRATGQTNFAKVATPGALQSRAALAASTPPNQVWVFNDAGASTAPALYRVACASAAAPVATSVAGVPLILGGQGFYDIAIAVDPTRPDRVALGGCNFGMTTPDGQAASDGPVVVADVALNGAVLTYGQPNPYTMVSIGVHSDVHEVKYSNGGNRLWACCDGGVLRSDRPNATAGFVPCNDGLAIAEPNYIALHPNCEGYMVIGLQDNAVLTPNSTTTWTVAGLGDGGGVVLDPLAPKRFFRQHFRGYWSTSDGSLTGTELLTRGGNFARNEFNASAFYSSAAAIAHRRAAVAPAAPDVGQIICGTNRLWYSEDFGQTWVTLPTGSDPLATNNTTQDGFGQSITVCRWQSDDVAWVLGEGRLMRYARTPGSDAGGAPGNWTRADIVKKGVKNKKDATSADGPIRDSAVWTDVAVNLDAPPAAGQPPAQHGTKGAVYLGTIGKPGDDNVDTLWWFDGTSKWFKTGLRTDATGVPAPVTAIVCDPAFPEEVYVGTTVGVWKGVRTQIGNANPAWIWAPRLNGLPESAVEDLAIFSDGGIRLLRAAIAARGVWELRLDTADVAELSYLRAHDDDLRYRARAIETQRDLTTPRSWHGSPDVRPRRAAATLPAPATLPWRRTFFNHDNEGLRRFQAALRAKSGDKRVRPTGQWDLYFNEVLRDLGAPLMPAPPFSANIVCVDTALWNANMSGAAATAEAWDTPVPTEADLYELSASLSEGDVAQASASLSRRKAKIDIVVHHRGLQQRDGANVRVTLLKWIDPKKTNAAKWNDATTWFAGNVNWTAAVNQVLNSADGKTATVPDAGWSFVLGTGASQSHRVTLGGQTLDTAHAGIASFDLDLSALKVNTLVLLVAVIRAGTTPADDVALTADTLQNLALNHANLAVRSLRVVA